jgi:hypothetical protein
MEDLKQLKIKKIGRKQLRAEERGESRLRRRKLAEGCSAKLW